MHPFTLPAALATLLGVLTLSEASFAESPVSKPSVEDKAPSAEDKATARALLDAGDALMKQGNVQGAHDKYKAADAIMNVPTTGLPLADAQMTLKQLVEAADTYARVQRYPVHTGEPKAYTVARAQAERHLTELAERIPTASLKLAAGEAEDAMRVSIDGRDISSAARFLPRKLNPGHHEAVIDSGNFRGSQSFELAERESRTVTVTLTPTGKPAFGRGNGSDAKPVAPSADGASKGAETPSSSGDGARVHPGVWVGVSVTGAAAVVGIITGVLALGAKKDLQTQCTGGLCSTPESESTYDSAFRVTTAATASFVLSGVAGGATALVYFLTKSTPPATSAGLTFVVGPSYLGLRGGF